MQDVLYSGGYRVEIHPDVIWDGKSDPDPVLFVSHPSLPGCCSDGRTLEEALEMLADARRLWIDVGREFGCPIPPPDLPNSEATLSYVDGSGRVQLEAIPLEMG